jgi:hypothetical protein
MSREVRCHSIVYRDSRGDGLIVKRLLGLPDIDINGQSPTGQSIFQPDIVRITLTKEPVPKALEQFPTIHDEVSKAGDNIQDRAPLKQPNVRFLRLTNQPEEFFPGDILSSLNLSTILSHENARISWKTDCWVINCGRR